MASVFDFDSIGKICQAILTLFSLNIRRSFLSTDASGTATPDALEPPRQQSIKNTGCPSLREQLNETEEMFQSFRGRVGM